MEQLPSKTQIGEVDCAGCGHAVPLKVNVNQCVYYFCARVLSRDENGKTTEKCMTRFNVGREGSKPIIQKYLNSQGENIDAQEPENREAPEGTAERVDVIGEGGGDIPDYGAENIIPDDEDAGANKARGGLFSRISGAGTCFD